MTAKMELKDEKSVIRLERILAGNPPSDNHDRYLGTPYCIYYIPEF